MDTFDEAQKRKKLTWPVIALMDFVTVIGFDDISISHSCHPSLSTIRQDTVGLAQKASSLLLNLMNDKEIQMEERRFILPVEVIQRDSTQKDPE